MMLDKLTDPRALQARLRDIQDELARGRTNPRQRDDLAHEQSLIEERLAALSAEGRGKNPTVEGGAA